MGFFNLYVLVETSALIFWSVCCVHACVLADVVWGWVFLIVAKKKFSGMYLQCGGGCLLFSVLHDTMQCLRYLGEWEGAGDSQTASHRWQIIWAARSALACWAQQCCRVQFPQKSLGVFFAVSQDPKPQSVSLHSWSDKPLEIETQFWN